MSRSSSTPSRVYATGNSLEDSLSNVLPVLSCFEASDEEEDILRWAMEDLLEKSDFAHRMKFLTADGRLSRDSVPYRQYCSYIAVEYLDGSIVHITVEMHLPCGCDIDTAMISHFIDLHRDKNYDDCSDGLGMIGQTFSTGTRVSYGCNLKEPTIFIILTNDISRCDLRFGSLSRR